MHTSRTLMAWTERHDVILARETRILKPFKFNKGSVGKGDACSFIADALNTTLELQVKVSLWNKCKHALTYMLACRPGFLSENNLCKNTQ